MTKIHFFGTGVFFFGHYYQKTKKSSEIWGIFFFISYQFVKKVLIIRKATKDFIQRNILALKIQVEKNDAKYLEEKLGNMGKERPKYQEEVVMTKLGN